jgi:hypothetical protein
MCGHRTFLSFTLNAEAAGNYVDWTTNRLDKDRIKRCPERHGHVIRSTLKVNTSVTASARIRAGSRSPVAATRRMCVATCVLLVRALSSGLRDFHVSSKTDCRNFRVSGVGTSIFRTCCCWLRTTTVDRQTSRFTFCCWFPQNAHQAVAFLSRLIEWERAMANFKAGCQ